MRKKSPQVVSGAEGRPGGRSGDEDRKEGKMSSGVLSTEVRGSLKSRAPEETNSFV